MGEVEIAEAAEAKLTENGIRERLRLDLADDIIAAFGTIVRRFRAAIPDAIRSQLGSTTAHQLEALHVLQHTRARGDAGVTMNELARLQGCALSTASALADRLLREGLVERVADESDRRVVRLVLTEKGEASCEEFRQVKRTVTLETLSELSVEDMETLAVLLRKIATQPAAAGAEVAGD